MCTKLMLWLRCAFMFVHLEPGRRYTHNMHIQLTTGTSGGVHMNIAALQTASLQNGLGSVWEHAPGSALHQQIC